MTESAFQAKDPVCGMTVNRDTNIKTMRDGKIIYFCSDHCMQKFLATPPPESPPLATAPR